MGHQTSDFRNALKAGTVLHGYVIESVPGHGGFGIVCRARHEELGPAVAIEEYLPIELVVREKNSVHPVSTDATEHDQDGLRRFCEEARQLVRFRRDPSVVTCLEFFRANGTAYT